VIGRETRERRTGDAHHSVALSVLEESEDELNRLDGPTTPGGTELGGLSSATGSAGKATEGNAALLLLDVLKVSESLLQVHAGEGGANLVGVLEVHTEVRSAGLHRLGDVLNGLGVANHCWIEQNGRIEYY